MANEYISRESALKAIEETDTMCDLTPDAYDRARRYIECIPAADVAEVIHGAFIPSYNGIVNGEATYDGVECSECYKLFDENEVALFIYCPYCGAKMREDD